MKTNIHPLKIWLEETGRSQRWLAKRAGIHYQYLWMILHGERKPSKLLVDILSELTDGKVAEDDFE